MKNVVANFIDWAFSAKNLILKAVLMFFLAAIYLVIPRNGDLVILKRAEVDDSNGKAISVIRNANAIARAKYDFAGVLTNRFVDNSEFVTIEETPGASTLENLVEASFELAHEAGDSNFRLNFKLTAIIQAYITRYMSSAESVHVMIEDWQDVSDDKHTMALSLLAESSALSLIDEPRSVAELSTEVGSFLVAKAYGNQNDCSSILCPTELPESEEDILLLARSLDALRFRRNAGVCRAIDSERECLAMLKNQVEPMADERDGGATADFTLFLVELSQLKQQVSAIGSSMDMAASFDKAHSRLLRAKSESEFFSKLVDDPQRFSEFLAKNGFTALELNSAFIAAYPDFIEGRRSMQQADYGTAIAHFDKVIPVSPHWFAGYLRADRLFASVEADIENESLLLEMLDYYRDGTEADHASPIWKASHAFTIQLLGERFSGQLTPSERIEFAKEARELWLEAISEQELEADRVGYMIEAARTQAAFLDGEERSKVISEITELGDVAATHLGEKAWRLTFMSMASWEARSKNYESSETWIRRSVELFPENICAVSNSRDFLGMKENDPERFAEFLGDLRSVFKPNCR